MSRSLDSESPKALHKLSATGSPVEKALRETLSYSRDLDYSGFNKHDGLNSPILNAILGRSRWPRIAAIQMVMRAPVNIRPLFGVPRTRNPKGIGLFANALLDIYATDDRQGDLEEACQLLEWLLSHPATGFKGLSWGYPYPWQDLGFFAPRHFPNRVVTCWIGFAFLEAVRLTGNSTFEQALPEIARFLTEEPNVLQDDDKMKCYSYVPDASVSWAVMDVPALVAAYLAEAAQILQHRPYRDEARRLLNWVVDKQTDYGAWYYTHPPKDSFIKHDNYHTAIILDCLDRYRIAGGDDGFDEAYWRGLRYYRDHLFSEQGAPRWMNDSEYPHDIHAAASAILCFVRAAYRDETYAAWAAKVIDWTLENLYDPDGYFYYQKSRFFTKRFCLLRWCNGWMSRALAATLRYCRETS